MSCWCFRVVAGTQIVRCKYLTLILFQWRWIVTEYLLTLILFQWRWIVTEYILTLILFQWRWIVTEYLLSAEVAW